jgi:transketolase
MRTVFPKFILDQIKKDKKIFVLLGDIGVHSFKDVFEKYKKNILNVGILEQSMISFASGLAMENRIPFVHTIAPFIVNRAFEQIKIDLCYQNLNVNLVTVGGSLDYAALGSTHHCPEDIGILSKLPNIKIYCPGNQIELTKLLDYYKLPGPKYFRLSNYTHNLSINTSNNGTLIKKGKKGLIIVIGPALRFIERYYEDLDVNIFYINVVKPLNNEMLSKYYHKNIIILQDFYNNSISGEIVSAFKNKDFRLCEIGLPNKFFLNYGDSNLHYNSLKLSSQAVKKKICNFLNSY